MACKAAYANKLSKWKTLKSDIENLNKKNKKYYKFVAINESKDEISLGNYKFKLFNVQQAFSGFSKYCKSYCCDDNVNSIIATAKNGNKYYYFAGDIQLYPEPDKKATAEQKKKLNDNRNKHPLDLWVKNAKKYWKNTGFNVFKASHHGITVYEGRVNNSIEAFGEAKPGIVIVTTSSKRNPLRKMIEEAENKYGFSCKVYFTGTQHQRINNNNI